MKNFVIETNPVYTLYEFRVPYVLYSDYLYFLEHIQDTCYDVSDYDDNIIYIGISYENKEEQKKLLKKLTKIIKKYYK